ncbi:MAG: DUF5680 domain-containing protein [Spirochaetota bacterium]
MNPEAVIPFLLRAKKATYAAKGAEAVPTRPLSHDLHYEEPPQLYIDTYLGGKKFAGEEAVWTGGTPIWSMNYYGRVLSDLFDGDVLKEALLAVDADMPFRGPELFTLGDYTYTCSVTGTFEFFSGAEHITVDGTTIYECVFHGGLIAE